jgi:hypothetical protein
MYKQTDKKTVSRWEKADISYQNYQSYIERKENKYDLELIDLLYISNFKGGNATIAEPEKIIKEKLTKYTAILNKIQANFGKRTLADLDARQVQKLSDFVLEAFGLSLKKETKIDGFGVSFLSALFNAHFPELIPIIDRRVLLNLNLVKKSDITKQKQIKNIGNYYEAYICQGP